MKKNRFNVFLVGIIIVLSAIGPLSTMNIATTSISEPHKQTENIHTSLTTMSLYQATTTYSSLVSVSIEGVIFALFYEKCINITLVQLTTDPVTIIIDIGVVLIPSDPGTQTMVIAKSYTISLTTQWEVNSTVVYAFCTESSDSAPDEESTFTVSSSPYGGSTCVGKILNYFENVNNTYLGTLQGQYAIWACIDGTASIYYAAEAFGWTSEINYLLSESGTGLTLGGGGGNKIPAFNMLLVMVVFIQIISCALLLPKKNKFQNTN